MRDGPGRTRLPPGLERELVLAAKVGPGPARDDLIEAFTPLVAKMARIYRGSEGVDRVELMQEGAVGLLRALERYDATLGTPFWPYATWWVRQAMQQLVSELTRPVVLSDRAARQLARVKDSRHELVQTHGREPTPRELAEDTGLTRKQVDNLIAAERKPRALDEPVHGDDDVATFGELLADPLAEEAYERVPPRLALSDLEFLLGGLSDRERVVVCARYGLHGPEKTLRELGGHLGVSVERVRQIEERALDKLRAAAEPAGVA
jgi:RNA polymerase sigma factor (sigma-70 family)